MITGNRAITDAMGNPVPEGWLCIFKAEYKGTTAAPEVNCALEFYRDLACLNGNKQPLILEEYASVIETPTGITQHVGYVPRECIKPAGMGDVDTDAKIEALLVRCLIAKYGGTAADYPIT